MRQGFGLGSLRIWNVEPNSYEMYGSVAGRATSDQDGSCGGVELREVVARASLATPLLGLSLRR